MAWLEIWADSKSRTTTCRSCKADIMWAGLVKSGKRMPFDAPIVAVLTKTDESGRQIEVVDTSVTTTHWASCPQRDTWRKGK